MTTTNRTERKESRANFLKATGLIGASLITGAPAGILTNCKQRGSLKSGRLKLRYKPYELHFKHVFTIAVSSRKTTPVMLVELEYEGHTGYGEASMPSYLEESLQTAETFLKRLDLSRFTDPFQMENILNHVDSVAPGNSAAKAAIDIALHDLVGKLMNQPWHRIWGYDRSKAPATSFTIGIDTPEKIIQKTREAKPYSILKVKLGRGTDRQIINAVRSVTDKPICVDCEPGLEKQKARA